MKRTLKFAAVFIALIASAVYYYITLPAINIHSAGFWMFLITALAVLMCIIAGYKIFKTRANTVDLKESRLLKMMMFFIIAALAVFGVGSFLSSEIINSKKYQQLMTVENGEFTEEIEPADFTKIPLLDKASATLLGDRKMGTMVDMVSQFEVSNIYTQINYNGKPVRVSPLEYASPIKWLSNHRDGIPAFIMIDMATQETECVRLPEGQYIRYSPAEYFNRNIYRHLRFRYPTFIFDTLSFEIDDEGTPYWICPVKKYNVGLFGGQTIGKVVLCNAVTGETACYDMKDVPTWIDHVYSADLLIRLYDYHGVLKHGFLNSVLTQKDCLQTTDGYNYIVKDDDVWVYTGVTSVSGDESNVGFVLMNQRTMESRYYSCPGAEEYSAMESAEGQVQHLGYVSTFPLLLNVSDEPTYFMALKDSAGLVKKYALVNISKYQNVAIGDTISECLKSYQLLLKENGITNAASGTLEEAKGVIEVSASVVIEGNSHYYLTLEGRKELFDVSVSEYPEIVTYQPGDMISFSYLPGTSLCEVVEIK
ncbi:MAG: CvpA family protein [Lachnospiraceae bacterium]